MPRSLLPRRNLVSVFVNAGLASLFGVSSAYAATLTVTSTADAGPGTLRDAVTTSASGDTIVFDCIALSCPTTITLSSQGNNQGFPGPTALSISSKSITVQGPANGGVTLQAAPGASSSTSLRHFSVDTSASLTLMDLILIGGRAIGGDGGSCGGAGAGLGGSIFSQGGLSLRNVTFGNNIASGGHGGKGGQYCFGSGGGGMGGSAPSTRGGGGGTGGDGLPGDSTHGGAGGPGYGGLGGGSSGIYNSANGGAGSGGGGGGTGVGAFGTWHGGPGSDGGGGGGSSSGGGGAGGFGGGAGGDLSGYGGYGGFGGGGGGSFASRATGGVGGGNGGHGYIGAYGFHRSGGGGGGGGLGGAVFVRNGTLSVQSTDANANVSGNGVGAGGGGIVLAGVQYGGGNGAAAGSGLFLMAGMDAIFDIATVYTVSDNIGDDSATSLPPGNSYMPGNGAGAGITKQGLGTLVLSGTNTFAGATAVNAGTLAGTGSIAGPVLLGVGAQVSPGSAAVNGGVGTFSTGPLTWNSGGAVAFQLGSTIADSDLLVVNGALAKVGSGPFVFHIGMGDTPPIVGVTYTLIQSADASAFSPGDFAFDTDATYQSLTGTFGIVGNAVQFTVNSVAADRVFANGFD